MPYLPPLAYDSPYALLLRQAILNRARMGIPPLTGGMGDLRGAVGANGATLAGRPRVPQMPRPPVSAPGWYDPRTMAREAMVRVLTSAYPGNTDIHWNPVNDTEIPGPAPTPSVDYATTIPTMPSESLGPGPQAGWRLPAMSDPQEEAVLNLLRAGQISHEQAVAQLLALRQRKYLATQGVAGNQPSVR